MLYFIQQHVVAAPIGKVAKAKAYEEYVKRCKAWNLMPIGEPLFRQEFLRLLRDLEITVKDGKVLAEDSDKRLNAYVGFELVDEKCHEEFSSISPAPLSPEAGA